MGNLMLNGISYSGGGDIDAILPIDTASGSVANFNTSIAKNLVSCVAQITAVQSGTGDPAPDNVRPITGFTGANVADISDSIEKATYIKGIYEGVNGFVDLGSLTWSKSTSTNNTFFYVLYNSGANGTYNTPATNIICSNYQNVARAVLTTVTNTEGIAMELTAIYIADMNCNNMTPEQFKSYISGKYIIYELATPEAPTITPVQFQTLCTSFDVNGALISVDWQPEAGTVYGGELDLTSGKLRVTHGITTFGDLTNFSRASFSGIDYYQGFISDKKLGAFNAKSEVFALGQTASVANMVNNTFMGDSSYAKIYIRCDDITTAEDFLTSLGSYHIFYELATPVEYQLTPQQITTFVGENNIWADTGDIAVSFKCTPQDYVDSKIASVASNTRSINLMKSEPEETKTQNEEIKEEPEDANIEKK